MASPSIVPQDHAPQASPTFPSRDLSILIRSLPKNRINLMLKETLCSFLERFEGLTPDLERLFKKVKPAARLLLIERASDCNFTDALAFLKSIYLRSIVRGYSVRAIAQREARKALRDEAIEQALFAASLREQEKSLEERKMQLMRKSNLFDVIEEANSSDESNEVDPFGFLKDF